MISADILSLRPTILLPLRDRGTTLATEAISPAEIPLNQITKPYLTFDTLPTVLCWRARKQGKPVIILNWQSHTGLQSRQSHTPPTLVVCLLLGLTYDPSVIKKLEAVPVTHDIDSALKWRQIAADRGSIEAADQYANLLRTR